MNLLRSPRLLPIWVILSIIIASTAITQPAQSATSAALPPIVFVARNHLATEDTVFHDELGPAGQFGTGLTKFAPGSKLVRRNADGSLFVYPTPGLIDVQAPDVNFDASKIVFAGATTLMPETKDAGWRLYEINVDGSGFHQLTFSDRAIVIPNANQFLNQEEYGAYSDLFPAYLADGPQDLNEEELRGFETVLITAGASAPELVVQNTIQWLKERFNATVEEQEIRREEVYFPLPKVLRAISSN